MAEMPEVGARPAAHTLLHALSSDHDQSKGSLFEYFAVVGLPPVEMSPEDVGTPQTPQILYAFPEEKSQGLDQNIKHFCFPNGVENRWIQTSRRMSSTDLHSVIFGSLTQLESSENSFIFLVTTDVLLFGVCVYVNELLGDPSALVREKMQMTGDLFADPSMKEKFELDSPKRRPVAAPNSSTARREAFHASLRRPTKTTTDVVTKRCYVFVTKYPFFSLHFEVLYGLLARDRLYRLQRTQGMLSGGPAPILGSEGDVGLILKSYYSQPVPKAGEAASFNLSSELRNIKFVCPPLDDITILADWALAASFKMLSLEIILTMFACALLEGRIAIVCQDLGILSAVALSLIPMLQPIVWQGILIPVLPSIMMDCLDAPVPIVLGVPEMPADRIGTTGDLLVIDIDKNEMTLPNIHYEDLPNKKELFQLLEPFHKKLFRRGGNSSSSSSTPSKILSARATYGMNPCKTTDAEIETVRCIQKVFTGYLDRFLDTFKHAIVKQKFDLHTDNFDTKIHDLVPLIPKNYRNFAKLFFETQQFNFFQEKFIQSVKRKKQDDHELFDRVQRLINMESEERRALEMQLKSLGSSGDRQRSEVELKSCLGRLLELKRQQDELVAAYPEFASRATPLADLDSSSRAPSFLDKLFGSSKK